MAEPVNETINTQRKIAKSGVKDKSEKVLKSRGLTAVIAKLRWQLWLRSFRKNVPQTIGMVILVIYAISILISTSFLFIGLSATSSEELAQLHPFLTHASLVGIFGSIVMIFWILQPLISSGLNNGFDPRFFASFNHSSKKLLKPVFLSSLLTPLFLIFSVFTAIIGATVVFWLISDISSPSYLASDSLNALLAAIFLFPSWCLALLFASLIPQVISTWNSTLRLSKRQRELLIMSGTIGFLALIYTLIILTSAFESFSGFFNFLITIQEFLLFTPIGAPFSAVIDLAQGNYLYLAIKIAITALSFFLLWKLWSHSFNKALELALQGSGSAKKSKVTYLVPSFLPKNSLGASTGLALKYWRRDSRFTSLLFIAPLVTIFLVASSFIGQFTFNAYLAIAASAYFAAISFTNIIGYDGPNGWVNITAGINTRAYLLGHCLAVGIIAIGWVILVSIVTPILIGQSEIIILALGLSFGFVLSAWGMVLVTSVLLPFPTPPPGVIKNSSSSASILPLILVMIGIWVPAIPSLILVILGLGRYPGLEYAGAILMLVLGILIFWLSLNFSAKYLAKNYATQWQKVKHFNKTN